MLLKTIKDNRLTAYHDHFDHWEDALKACGEPLKKEGYIDDQYVTSVINCVKEYGPYIVLAKDVAMPHSSMGAVGVYKNGIGFMRVKDPVIFDENDREKDARLFFTLAAVSSEEHLNNMVQLSELLMNEELVADLLNVTCDEDLETVIKKYQ